MPDWTGLRAYTRNVAIPMSIGVQMLGKGLVGTAGVITPEDAFDPAEVFGELEKRQIPIHSRIEEPGDGDFSTAAAGLRE